MNRLLRWPGKLLFRLRLSLIRALAGEAAILLNVKLVGDWQLCPRYGFGGVTIIGSDVRGPDNGCKLIQED